MFSVHRTTQNKTLKGGNDMSQNIPNLLDKTISKMREMIDVDSVIGEPINAVDGVTIIPISKVSVGFAGGGSDYVSKHPNKHENPFGGGAGGGMSVTPIAFLVIKDGSVRMLPVAMPANTTTERIVEMVPDLLDKLTDYIDSRREKKAE
jgi:sporulation protein YtfJ